MSQTENLPQESESQRIGRLAEKCFGANMPNDWAATDLGGTEDFGFDFQVQDVRAGYARNIFRVQLKGTMHPSLNADSEFYSIQLSTSTVNLYRRTNEPVLLVVADLTIDPDAPKNCHLYYVWIHEELRRVTLDKASVTLRVPTANQLTNSSNLSGEVERILKLGAVGQALDVSMEDRRPDLSPDDRATMIGNIPASFAERGIAFFDVMAESPEESWPSPKAGSMPWFFREADHHLKDGDASGAESALQDAEKLLASAVPLEQSDFWHLKGRLFQLKGDEASSRDAFAQSASVPNSPQKNIVSWAESELRLLFVLDGSAPPDLSHILSRLTDPSKITASMRARVLAAEGKFTEALECANSFDGVESSMAKAIIHCMQGEFERTLEVCEEGLAQSAPSKHGSQLFILLRARARFSLALRLKPGDYDVQLPPSGPAKTDVDQLSQVWTDIQAAVKEFQRVGWPPNIDYLADVWSASSIMLGKQKDALPLLSAAAQARPHLLNLQRALELVAVHCDDLKLALEANLRLPFDDLAASHRLTLLHNLKRDEECVDYFEKTLPFLDIQAQSFGAAAAMAALSAHRIIKTGHQSAWLTLLNSHEHLKPYAAVAEYFIAVDDNGLASAAAADTLWDKYEKLGEPLAIAQQLIGFIDPSTTIEAHKCKTIAARLTTASLLNLRVSLLLAQAMTFLQEWQPLLDLCNDAQRRYSDSSQLAAYRALALEKLGHTAEALDTLKTLIAQGVSDPLPINTYINIVVRCGFGHEAVATVTSILSAAETRERKLDCLRLLFNLVHIASPTDTRVLEFATRYGALCDRSDEVEEGMFLSMVLRARLSLGTGPANGDNVELGKRFDDFFVAFPASRIIRRGEVARDAKGEEVMLAISKIVGSELFDQEWIDLQTKLTRELERGELPFPYAWRPRNILLNVGDLPFLWEIGKHSKHGEHQYQLVMAPPQWKSATFSEVQRKIPLLDFTALLVTYDLGLFELLFCVFPRIAIAQGTVNEISKLSTPLLGGAARDKCAMLLQTLRANFEKIQQPHAVKPAVKDYLHWPTEEIKLILSRGDFQLYSDDLIFRAYCADGREDVLAICTLDVINALVTVSAMTPQDAARKIATLCSWKVGITIEHRHIAYAVPASVANAKSLNEAATVLRADNHAMSILNGIWDPTRPYNDALAGAGALLSHLMEGPNSSLLTMASLMDVWCGKAKLRADSKGTTENIANLVAHTATLLSQNNSSLSARLKSVYAALVEMVYGSQMDERKEMKAIEILGRVSGEIDLTRSLNEDQRLRERIGSAFTAGTSEEDAYLRGYADATRSAVMIATSDRPSR